MKQFLLILSIILITATAFGQVPQRRTQAVPPPLPFREVSGIVKDTTDQTLPGAVVILKSKVDSMVTAANADGIFVFRNVKSASFTLTITSMGYRGLVKKFLNNDAVPRLVLDPIILKTDSKLLKTVVVNGTPSIVYKTDTVEYKASDYHVRENATVDELLKKMEGMEVGSDGTVTHQGQQITKAKLNGKLYSGGDVAQAIQNLPAEIVDKIQVVDDYGDQAARTGIKDGDPEKILNITTRADRSVGTTGRLTGQAGNDDRYNARLFLQRINANQQIGLIGNLANTQNGVASTGIAGGATNGGGGGTGVGAGARGGGSPGTTLSGAPTLNYRDQWSKILQVNSSFGYNFRNNKSTNDSYGERVSTLGPTDFKNHSDATSKNHGQLYDAEFDFQLDSANYLQIRPQFTTSNATSSSTGFTDNVNHYAYDYIHHVSGYSHQFNNSSGFASSSTPTFNGTLLYSHNFKTKRRVFSLNFSTQIGSTESVTDRTNDYKYLDSASNAVLKDSLSHTIQNRTSKHSQYRTSVTYSEPLGAMSRLDFNGQSTVSTTHNIGLVDTVSASGLRYPEHGLDNIFNTVASESRGSLAFRYEGSKLNYGIGAQLVYRRLSGDKIDNSNTGQSVETSRGDFKVIPVLRASYSWSRTERLTFTYSGTNSEPNFTQIQPFTDRTDPNNIVVGNPNLKQTFINSYNVQYNNYFPNSRFNLSFGLNGTFVDDQVSTNVIQLPPRLIVSRDPHNSNKLDTTTQRVNETTYINISGSHSYVGRYNISKQLDDRRYNLQLNGNITYGYNNAMSNNISYHTTQWRFDERFGPRITPNDNIELNPTVGYDVSRQFTNLRGTTATNVRTTSLAIDGRIYFLKTLQVHFDAHQNFIKGLTGLNNTSPLIINAGFQEQFFKRKQLTMTFDVFDLLHQNNAIQQTLGANGGFTNTQSNTLSRYFLVGFILNMQKWSGRPSRNGKQLQRRGDGSFVY